MQGMMQETFAQLTALLGPQVVRILGALVILVAGWLVALLGAAITRGALKRTTLDNRLAEWILDEKKVKSFEVEKMGRQGRLLHNFDLCSGGVFQRSAAHRHKSAAYRFFKSALRVHTQAYWGWGSGFDRLAIGDAPQKDREWRARNGQTR